MKRIISNYNLIVLFLCIGFWALLYLVFVLFKLNQYDFIVFYNSGKQIFIDPSKLYEDVHGYYYMPIFALLMSPISLFDIFIAHYVFYVINYVSLVLIVREFNKILSLKNFTRNLYKMMILLVVKKMHIKNVK